jgi:hypothetical protein
MATKIRLALCALPLAASIALALQNSDSPPVRATGHVLVLDTERTVEGDIERVGDQYRVRRGTAELWVQKENVLRLCTTREEAYDFLRSQANLRDPDEHLRLARWCQSHGLRPQALTEVTEAVQLRPNDAEARRFQRGLQRSLTVPVSPPSPASAAAARVDTTPPAPPVDTESLSLFVTRVQPVLMNACASCHATGHGGSFTVVRTFDSDTSNHKAMQYNLAAVLSRVNLEQPQSSLFLAKAISVHGPMPQPAFKGRDAPAYRALEDWVMLTIEKNPQLRLAAGLPVTPVVTPPRSANDAAANVSHSASPPNPPAEPSPQTVSVHPSGFASDYSGPTGGEGKEAPKAPTASAATEPVDPYDPIIFNKRLHPEKVADKEPGR